MAPVREGWVITAYVSLILAQAMVGINIVGTKYLVSSVPILFILAVRFSLATGILWVLHLITDRHRANIRHHLAKLNKRDWIFIIAQALTAGVLFNVLMISGLRYTSANVAGIITSALPALITMMCWIVLKETLSAKKILCVAFATLGLVVISADKWGAGETHQSFIGNLIIILSLLPEAAYYVLSKMHVNLLPIFLIAAIISGINAIVVVPIMLLQVEWQHLHMTLFDGLILITVSLSSGLFFVFWYLGSDKVDGVMASLSTAMMPIATVSIAWFALGEVITPTQFLGMGLVIASIFSYALK